MLTLPALNLLAGCERGEVWYDAQTGDSYWTRYKKPTKVTARIQKLLDADYVICFVEEEGDIWRMSAYGRFYAKRCIKILKENLKPLWRTAR